MSHHISLYLIISHHVSSYLIISHHISSCLIISHHISSYLRISHHIYLINKDDPLQVEDILSKQRYLVGEQFTEADIRLFVTAVRFDTVYHGLFKVMLIK